MLVAIYQFCLWIVAVTVGTLLYYMGRLIWERVVRPRLYLRVAIFIYPNAGI